MEIPVIDVSEVGLLIENEEDVKVEDYTKIGNQLYKALSEVGFAYLRNTGIAEKKVNELQDVYQKFFDLDFDVKKKFDFADDVVGYVWPGKETLGTYGQKEYKEAFNVNGTFHTNADKMSPEEYVPGFKDDVLEFCEICAKLSLRLFKVLAYGMKLKDVDFLAKCHSRLNGRDNHTALRSNYYPPITDDVTENYQVRLGGHSDYGSFTLLFQDNKGGLQVHNDKGEFVDAPYIPETIVMNIGDIMNLWTDGRLKSTVHQVAFPKGNDGMKSVRKSMAYFLHSDDEIPIEKMEYLEDADPPRPERVLFDPNDKYKTAFDWLMCKFFKAHGRVYEPPTV